jgi:hypothetical protein
MAFVNASRCNMSDKKNRINVTVVPAVPGSYVAYEDDEDGKATLTVDECPVLAWRVETLVDEKGEICSHVDPLTIDGDSCSNAIGVQHPDGKVTHWYGATYASLTDAEAHQQESARPKGRSPS